MRRKIFKNVVACLMIMCLFSGLFFNTRVSAAGPDASEKKGSIALTLCDTENRKTVGSILKDPKSTYFKFKTKRTYNVDVTIVVNADVRKKVDIQVWNNKGQLMKSLSQTSTSWTFNSKTSTTKNEFTVKKLKKGTYYIEVKEKGTNANVPYSVKVVPHMREKIKDVTAKQVSSGTKKVKISWTPLSGDAVTGYKVYKVTKKKNGKLKYTLVTTVYGADSKSVEVKAALGTTYTYKVRAFYYLADVDVNLFSKYSEAVTVTTK